MSETVTICGRESRLDAWYKPARPGPAKRPRGLLAYLPQEQIYSGSISVGVVRYKVLDPRTRESYERTCTPQAWARWAGEMAR